MTSDVELFRLFEQSPVRLSLSDSISIQASTISSVEGPDQKVTLATFTAILQENLPPRAEEKLCIDFIAHTLREHVCTSVRT